MNRSISPDTAVARVRCTLESWAEDMADGDGVAWDPIPTSAPMRLATRPQARTRPRLVLGIAAAVVIIVGMAVAAISASREGQPARLDTAGDGETPAGVDEVTEPSPTAPTSPPTSPPTSGPNVAVDVPVATYVRERDGAVITLRWYSSVALTWPDRPGSDDLQVGPHAANYWEEPDQEVSSLALFFADGVLYLDGDETGMRDDLVALAEGITRVPGTTEFEITPPPGYMAS